MTIDKPSKTEKLRAFLRKPYVRIPLILVVLLYAGFVVVLIFVAIASLYTLGTLVGIPTIQLVIGTVSAMGTLTSAGVAYLLYRSSVRGAHPMLHWVQLKNLVRDYILPFHWFG